MPAISRVHRFAAAAFVLVLVTTLAMTTAAQEAPSAAPETSPPPAGVAIVNPEGDWEVLAFDPWSAGLVEPEPGSTFTASLLPGGRLEGLTGCGQYHGVWSVDGERIDLHVVSKGPDPCGTRKTEEAVAFSVALDQASTWRPGDSGLELLDDAGAVRAVLVGASTAGLAGDWIVKRYAKPNGVLIDPPIDETIKLSFDETGGLTGTTGCRLLEGSYESVSDRVVIAPVDTTGLPCEGDLRKVERRLLRILDATVLWSREGQRLRLLTGPGEPLLVLDAAEPPAEPSPEPPAEPSPEPSPQASPTPEAPA